MDQLDLFAALEEPRPPRPAGLAKPGEPVPEATFPGDPVRVDDAHCPCRCGALLGHCWAVTTCQCLRGRGDGDGFSSAAVDGREWWVHAACGNPTAAWLAGHRRRWAALLDARELVQPRGATAAGPDTIRGCAEDGDHLPVTYNPWLDRTFCLCGVARYPGNLIVWDHTGPAFPRSTP